MLVLQNHQIFCYEGLLAGGNGWPFFASWKASRAFWRRA